MRLFSTEREVVNWLFKKNPQVGVGVLTLALVGIQIAASEYLLHRYSK